MATTIGEISVLTQDELTGNTTWKLPNGDLHRVNGPATHHPSDGRTTWWLYGERHRNGGPAVYGRDISHEWYQHGTLHRLDGPSIVHPNGEHEYYVGGKLHRLDGPAIETPGSGIRRGWYVDDCKIMNPGVLDELYDSGSAENRRILELVLSAWSPGGPQPYDLHQAVIHAHA